MDVLIRGATMDDYNGICTVLQELDAFHAEVVPHVYQAHVGPARSREYIAHIIENPDAAIFVAEHDRAIVGVLYLFIRESPDLPFMVKRRYVVIDTLGVASAFRRQGIGRLLMERAHQWAVDKGLTQLELGVWEFNQSAIAFYEDLGYTTAIRRMWKTLD